MSLRNQWFVLGASAACALGLAFSGIGCRTDSTTGGTASTAGEGGSGATTGSSMNVGGNSGTAGGGGNGTAGGSSTGGAGGGGGFACVGSAATIEQINDPTAVGTVGDGSAVELKGVVATSRKFLINQSKSGTCLWGVYVSSPGLPVAKEYSGAILVARGIDAYIAPGGNKAFCPKLSNYKPDDKLPGDPIPDDTMPGDVLDVIGVVDSYVPSTCGQKPGESKLPMKQVSFICSVTKTGTAAVPAPKVFSTPDEMAMIADQANADFHAKWAATRIRVEGVTPVPQAGPPGGPAQVVVGDFGIITLATSNVQVGDSIYYRGYEKGNDECFTGPVFTNLGINWNFIQGHHYLNYCTWGMEPSNKCADFDSASEDCAAMNLMCK